jgi:Ran GTPase-activating protein (RanGAP) involved in mRNA processing and transport
LEILFGILSKGSNSLKSFKLHEVGLDLENKDSKFKGFLEKTKATSLVLSKNMISLQGALTISQGLILNKSLTRLDLSKNQIGPKGTQLLCESLREHEKLRYLDLSSNKIGDQGAFKVARLIEHQIKKNQVGNAIQILKMSKNGISSEGMIPLFNALTPLKNQT